MLAKLTHHLIGKFCASRHFQRFNESNRSATRIGPLNLKAYRLVDLVSRDA